MRLATRLLTILTIAAAGWLGLSGCNKQGDAETQKPSLVPAGSQAAKPSGKPAAPAFKLMVAAPAGKVGQELSAEVKVVPRGEYKINLEYPHKLKVSGPAAASPKETALAAKDAKISKAELSFKPTFKLTSAGEHTFTGKLRFSVCTEKQCEIKAEKVKWVFKVTEP
jgi:hypothetical protein